MSQYSTPKLDALALCAGYVFEVDSVFAMLMDLDDVRKLDFVFCFRCIKGRSG